VLQDRMVQRGRVCRCIRCREIGLMEPPAHSELVTRSYSASGGTEFFISVETPDHTTLLGFARLRISPATNPAHAGHATDAGADVGHLTPFPELAGAALLRELHVYGQLVPTAGEKAPHAQHVGLGKRLMAEAERVAAAHGAHTVAVISGVGAREFYRKIGYELRGEGRMMLKVLLREGPCAVASGDPSATLALARERVCRWQACFASTPVSLPHAELVLGGLALAALGAAWLARRASAT